MSLESILEHILSEGQAACEKIIQEAQQQAQEIIQQAQREADKLFRESIDKEKALCEKEKQRRIVNARLEYKKNLLAAKQELINSVFKNFKSRLARAELKKEQVTRERVQEVAEDIDFYLGQIRRDYESQIAKILFK